VLIAGGLVFAAGTFAGWAALIVEVAGAALTGAAFAWLGRALLRGVEGCPVGAAGPRPG
jgi:hypothetical protein